LRPHLHSLGDPVRPVGLVDGAPTFTGEYRRGACSAGNGCQEKRVAAKSSAISGRSDCFLVGISLSKSAAAEVDRNYRATSEHP
tara:strand:+ start:464 stop:715 length:252 start_codon:yes stop_codon:yes gene_type:complete